MIGSEGSRGVGLSRAVAIASLCATACRTTTPGGTTSGTALMFRGDARHTGVYQTRAPAHFGGLLWRARTSGPVRSTPAVDGNVVFVGSADGHLYAFDASTGQTRWRFDAGSAITSSPAVAGGRVFFTGRDGSIFAVEEASGALQWRRATGPDMPMPWGHESGDMYTSSPALIGGMLLVGSGDGRLYALDAATGRGRWTFQTGGRLRSSPAVDSGAVFIGSVDGSLYAVDLATGRQLWRFDTEGHSLASGNFGYDRRTIQSSPAVVGELVVVGARDGFLYAVNRRSGQLMWRFDHKVSWVNTSAAVEVDAVYSGTSDGHFFQRIDPRTGTEIWRDSVTTLSFSSPAVVGDAVYAVDATCTLYVRDKATGRNRWHYSVGGACWSSPVVADSVVYMGNDDGSLYALRLSTGSPLARAVYWDTAYARIPVYRTNTQLVAFLADRGYAVLDAQGLATFMTDRARDGAPSVVVFAVDDVPTAVAPLPSDTVLFRRYLDKGGKVVWLGVPPLLWPRDTAHYRVSLDSIVWTAPSQLLGVDLTKGNFHPRYGATATAAGRQWGLDGWWLTTWSADPATVTQVLALDENGLAASWVRSYGGPPGTGYVQLYCGVNPDAGGPPLDFRAVQTAAEYRPR